MCHISAIMLTKDETLIALVSNCIAVYSILQEREEISDEVTLYGFVLDNIPGAFKENLTSELIDDVFEAVAHAHNS